LVNQNDVFNIIEIAQGLKNKLNFIFFISDIYTNYDVNKSTYYLLKQKFPESKIYDLSNELIYLNCHTKHKVDFTFLKNFESQLKSELIIQNFLKDIDLNNIYGYRDLTFHPLNKKNYFILIEKITKKISKIFSSNGIDLVYSPDTSNFARNLIRELCKKKKIPFYWISHRILGYLYLVNLSGKKKLPLTKNNKIDKKKIISIKKILEENSKNIENKTQIIPLSVFFKRFNKNIFNFFQTFRNNYLGYKRQRLQRLKPNLFSQKSILNSYKYWLTKIFRQYTIQKYCLKNLHKKILIIKKKKFIFYPLHVTPEAGVYDQKELYDQLYIIQKISKQLPIDYFLVVKLHPSNFSEDSDIEKLNWYKKIDKIYNVVLLSHHINSSYLIKKSIAVITISGSACIEANLINKPSFLIGDAEFSELYGIYKFDKKFLDNIRKFDKRKLNNNNIFYNYIFNDNTRLDNYSHFIYPGSEKIRSKYKNIYNLFSKKILNS
jgi:hypothetical protein